MYSIPELWSSISITRTSNSNERKLPHINHRLQRSGQSPLFIELDSGSNLLPILRLSEILDAIEVVKQNLHRTAYLCLTMPNSLLVEFTCGPIRPGAAPILEEFHIHNNSEDPCSIDINLCANLPRPWKVAASNYLVSKVHLDWFHVSQLTLSFEHMDSPTVNDLLDLLSMAKSLVEFGCRFKPIEEYRAFLTPVPRLGRMIIHNSIQKLILRDHRTADAIFLHTTIPSLESLTLSNLLPATLNALSRFLQRSLCPLVSLALSFTSHYYQSEGDGLLSFLKRLSLVTDTSLDSAAQLQVANRDHPRLSDMFLPRLQKLKYSGKVYFPFGVFLDIMENRHAISLTENSQASALEELEIHARSPTEEAQTLLTEGDLEQILGLRAARKTVSVLQSYRSSTLASDLVKEAMEVHGLGNN